MSPIMVDFPGRLLDFLSLHVFRCISRRIGTVPRISRTSSGFGTSSRLWKSLSIRSIRSVRSNHCWSHLWPWLRMPPFGITPLRDWPCWAGLTCLIVPTAAAGARVGGGSRQLPY